MEKADVKSQEAQSDTSSVINMKEYAASEYPSSEPPPVYMIPAPPYPGSDLPNNNPRNPNTKHQSSFSLLFDIIFSYGLHVTQTCKAYMKPRQNALRIARLAAFTVITSAVILGGFILAASWIQANTARNLDLTLNQELMDDLHPSYEHLVANEVLPEQQDNNLNQDFNDEKKPEQQQQQQQEMQVPNQGDSRQNNIPPQEDKAAPELDDIANMLVQKGMRGNVNCIVEKRRNEELVDHAPRALSLPFGLNITTPPRLQHLTGEQVVIICKDNNEQKEDDKEEPEQPMLIPAPPQLLNQIQQGPQIIPISQILQHLNQQPQQPVFVPQQPQQEQQVFYNTQPIYQQQPQPQVFYPQQQPPQQVFVPQQQFSYHMPQPNFGFPQQEPPVQQQQMPVPLREVPISQLMNRMPINPLAVQDVPMSQMPITHMPMREPTREQRMQPIPVHHLVPPRPQQMRLENFGQEEESELPAAIRERLMQREREIPRVMMQPLRPRPLPLEAREPRLMRDPVFPPNDNALPEFPPRSAQQPAFPPRVPPGRRFRFPDSSENEGMAITRIIPIRLEKDSEEENSNGVEEKRPLPIPLNAILDMVFKGIRPFVGRQPFPVPIDIKIERIESRPIIETSSESEESREEEEQESQEEGEQSGMTEEKPEESNEAKVQQVEIVEKEGENTQAIPIPADAQDAQVFKLEDKPEGEWAARPFLPNGQGRGGVFPIPQAAREAQIFTVSDARAGVPMAASFDVSPKEESREARVLNLNQPEGEVNLFPVPMNSERSVRLYPVDEQADKPEKPEQKVEQGEQAEESRPHYVQPRSV